MSAISSSSQPISTSGGQAVIVAEVDASCRAPVLILFASAIAWLLIGSVFEMIATLKFHAPKLLSDCPVFTYGRVHAAHLNSLVYGFAVQAGLGVILWITAHLSRVKLQVAPAAIAGALLWNLGMVLGTLGILGGEANGFEWLEMPRYGLAMLFWGYALVAVSALVTVHQRSEREFYVSQWFIIAALFWFPWIFSTATLLLVIKPVRGALQTGIDFWYSNNLMTVWFGLIGLAAIFYFIPKVTKRPFYSHYLGMFIFWVIVLFGSWGGIPPVTPLPSWMSAMSSMGSMITLVAVISVAVSVGKTMCGGDSKAWQSRPFKFFVFATFAYVVAGLGNGANACIEASKVTEFTWFVPAVQQLYLYGFFAMAMFGAIYYIVPRLLEVEYPAQGAICGQFIASGGGILIFALSLAIGGLIQGAGMNDASKAFLDVSHSTLMFVRISTLGDLLILVGNLTLLLNFAGLLVKVARAAGMSAWETNTKTVEVAP